MRDTHGNRYWTLIGPSTAAPETSARQECCPNESFANPLLQTHNRICLL